MSHGETQEIPRAPHRLLQSSHMRRLALAVGGVLLVPAAFGGCSDDGDTDEGRSGVDSTTTSVETTTTLPFVRPVRVKDIRWPETEAILPQEVCDSGGKVEGDPDAAGRPKEEWPQTAILTALWSDLGDEKQATLTYSTEDAANVAQIPESDVFAPALFNPEAATAAMGVGEGDVCFSFAKWVLNSAGGYDLVLVPTNVEPGVSQGQLANRGPRLY